MSDWTFCRRQMRKCDLGDEFERQGFLKAKYGKYHVMVCRSGWWLNFVGLRVRFTNKSSASLVCTAIHFPGTKRNDFSWHETAQELRPESRKTDEISGIFKPAGLAGSVQSPYLRARTRARVCVCVCVCARSISSTRFGPTQGLILWSFCLPCSGGHQHQVRPPWGGQQQQVGSHLGLTSWLHSTALPPPRAEFGHGTTGFPGAAFFSCTRRKGKNDWVEYEIGNRFFCPLCCVPQITWRAVTGVRGKHDTSDNILLEKLFDWSSSM